MEKLSFRRIRRSRKLSSAEVARDEEIRHKVRVEFPPLETAPKAPLLSDPLKTAIQQSEKSVRQLAKDAKASLVVLRQFLAGQRDLRLATAEKLAQALGLKLVAV